MSENPLRNLPSVDQLLQHPLLQQVIEKASRSSVVQKVRDTLDDVRNRVAVATEDAHVPTPQEIVDTVASWVHRQSEQTLRPVINATGVLLHTGLGRAPLPSAATHEIQLLAERYSSLEFDLETGERGNRTSSVEALICELTGAEAATVVNNNAAATMLTLASLCSGREVIVSRGQLVEIGGSYRLPEVMSAAGCRLIEVGTTNKTRVEDYQNAISENTAAILRVHPSNYVVCGFTESASLKQLSDLATRHSLPLIDDIGSGAVLDFARFGLKDEPLVSESVAKAAVSLFSGDKLLGGPQCGIIVGRRSKIRQIVKHPMMRALRVGKLTIAALQGTLKLYRDPEIASERIPLLRMLQTSTENLQMRAAKLVAQLQHHHWISEISAVESEATLGGGSLPTQSLPSIAIRIRPANGTVSALAETLRRREPPLVGRIQADALLLDLKTVGPNEDRLIVEAFEHLNAAKNQNNSSGS